MIKFDKLWKTMEKKGRSTYWLREKCGIDRKTIRRLKSNDNMETKTLNKLCIALECKLEDIAEFVEEEWSSAEKRPILTDRSYICSVGKLPVISGTNGVNIDSSVFPVNGQDAERSTLCGTGSLFIYYPIIGFPFSSVHDIGAAD